MPDETQVKDGRRAAPWRGLVLALWSGAAVTTSAIAADGSRTSTMARIGAEAITASEVYDAAQTRLFRVRAEEYRVLRAALDEIVDARLLASEAGRRGVSSDELVRVEVDAQVAIPTDAEVTAEATRSNPRGAISSEDARALARRQLTQSRRAERRSTYLRELRKAAGVQVLLEEPRASLEVAHHPSFGPAAAAVTIVEFSDFQCPYCARAAVTLRQLQERYPATVRLVHFDFPLANHRNAPKAAEAAGCAGDQGKFWEMRERLFVNQSHLEISMLGVHAVALGLDREQFDRCLESGNHAPDWRRDLATGSRYGVTGTPTFFVNGRFLSGAQPFSAFVNIVEDELARAAVPRGDTSPRVPASAQPGAVRPE